MSDLQEKLMESVVAAQQEAARNYVKALTSFIIGFPPGGDKLHVMLIDLETKEVIKKINCARFIFSNNSDELSAIMKSAINQSTTR